MGVGFAVMFAQAPGESFTVSPFWPIAGWFCGFAAAEMVLARRGGPLGRPLGLRLAPPQATGLWVFAAMVSGAIALASVLRSFRTEVDLAERGWAVFTLAVVLTVNLLVMGLRRRPLRAGPADLVSAEWAMRSRSARLLLAGGTIVAIWSAPGGGWSSQAESIRSLLGLVVSLLAWYMTLSPERLTQAGRPLRWQVVAAVLLTPVLAAGWNAAVAEPDEQPQSPLTEPHANAALFAYVAEVSGQWELATIPKGREPDDEWDESTWDFGGFSLDRAVTRLATGDGGRQEGPLALSGDGHHVVYLDSVTDRLVVQHLSEATRRDLTGPLPAHAVPRPLLSHDGRLAALVSGTGTELVDTATGDRTALPGVRRVLGLGPYGVVGTTGHRALPGAPGTELVTLDPRGRVRSRAPFDPTLPALATRDGRSLIVFTDDEAVTMDARTGRVTDRAALKLPRHHGPPEPLGWSAEGRLAVLIEPDGDDGHYHLVDPGTGRSSPMKGVMDKLDHGVFGLIP
ncbi:hypothetical protein AB0K05_00855 [Nonomuraea sp. NPDC049486]|uniref:hypothetical protein n=1 Tax=Nonomuraea sp. NPDC049486 TaxID=3155773 RepID=UPI0034463531